MGNVRDDLREEGTKKRKEVERKEARLYREVKDKRDKRWDRRR